MVEFEKAAKQQPRHHHMAKRGHIQLLVFPSRILIILSFALQLFRKRYAKVYDTHVALADVDKKGYVTFVEYEKWYIKALSPTVTEEKVLIFFNWH